MHPVEIAKLEEQTIEALSYAIINTNNGAVTISLEHLHHAKILLDVLVREKTKHD